MSVHRAKNLLWSSALGFYSHFKSFFDSVQREMTPEQQQQDWERSETQTALQNSSCDEFHIILGGNATTGAHSSDFPVFLWIALPCPWHQARRNPPWWNLPTGWAVKSTLQPGSPSTAAKNNRDNRWRESWDVEANVPQASFVFSVRGNFFHAIPLVVCWEWLVQCFSSPEFSWLCKLWLTLGIAEVQHLWHWEQRLGNSSSWGSAAFEIIGESILCTH